MFGCENVVGKLIIKKGHVQTWKFQTECNVVLGVIDFDKYKNGDIKWSFTDRDGAYGFSTSDGNTHAWDIESFVGDNYADKCNQNEIISMTLDMTGDEYGTLSFKIDDEEYGNAFDKIDIDKEYCMIVTLYNQEKIRLLQ